MATLEQQVGTLVENTTSLLDICTDIKTVAESSSAAAVAAKNETVALRDSVAGDTLDGVIFDPTKDQTVTVAADGGRTFNYYASGTKWVIPEGTTAAQINELWRKVPKVSNAKYINYTCKDGTYYMNEALLLPATNYRIVLEGNKGDSGKSSSKAVTFDFTFDGKCIDMTDCNSVEIRYMAFKNSNFTETTTRLFECYNIRAFHIDSCYCEATPSFGLHAFIARCHFRASKCVFAHGYRYLFTSTVSGTVLDCDTRDQSATYQSSGSCIRAIEGSHVGTALNTLFSATAVEEADSTSTLI